MQMTISFSRNELDDIVKNHIIAHKMFDIGSEVRKEDISVEFYFKDAGSSSLVSIKNVVIIIKGGE